MLDPDQFNALMNELFIVNINLHNINEKLELLVESLAKPKITGDTVDFDQMMLDLMKGNQT